MRGLLCVALVLFALCVCFPALAEAQEVVQDGVIYALSDGIAAIVGIGEGAQSVTVRPEIEGLPTVLPEGSEALGEGLEEIIFAEGVASLTLYHGLLSHVRRIALPGSFDPAAETHSDILFDSFIDSAARLETLALSAQISEADFYTIVDWARERYRYSQHEIDNISVGYMEPYDPALFRSFHSIQIAPNHPTLYDVDGIVYQKGSGELLACLPGRAGAVSVAGGTKAIGPNAFEFCDQIESVALPMSLVDIGESAFSGCGSLRAVQLPPTLGTIGMDAFRNCHSLLMVAIPDGVAVAEGAFDYCRALRAVYVQGSGSVIDPTAFLRCHPDLVLYAGQDTPGYTAAALSEMLWAELGGEPVRLSSPLRVHKQPAYVHAEDEGALLPLYEAPSEQAKVVRTLRVGDTVDVLGTEEDWALVAVYEAEGYLPRKALQLVQDNAQLEKILQVQALDEVLTLYEGPSTEAQSVEKITWDRYPVIEQLGAWYRIDCKGTPWYVPVSSVNSFGLLFERSDARIVVCREGERRAKLYAEPSETGEVVGEFYEGTQMAMIDSFDRSFVEAMVGGIQGFFARDNCTPIHEEWYYYTY